MNNVNGVNAHYRTAPSGSLPFHRCRKLVLCLSRLPLANRYNSNCGSNCQSNCQSNCRKKHNHYRSKVLLQSIERCLAARHPQRRVCYENLLLFFKVSRSYACLNALCFPHVDAAAANRRRCDSPLDSEWARPDGLLACGWHIGRAHHIHGLAIWRAAATRRSQK